ncbi:MAG: sulfur carrier protein ThiS [Hadesarchaea archaeon]|nr:sulfur carrier protein ThiS [Hadesarchaea archaeon]
MAVEVRVKIVGQRSTRRVKVEPGTTIAELLKKVGQNRETVVVRLNGRIVAEEEPLKKGDLVEILPVVTGG